MSDASNTTVVIKTENLGKSYRLYLSLIHI